MCRLYAKPNTPGTQGLPLQWKKEDRRKGREKGVLRKKSVKANSGLPVLVAGVNKYKIYRQAKERTSRRT